MSQKILVTGAGGGFGKLTVQTLLQKGHSVAGSLRDATGRNKSAAEELRSKGAHIVEIDVTRDESVDTGVKEVISSLGGLDVIVNNAGIGVLGLQETFTPEDWQKLFDVNLFGVQRINRAVLPHMRDKGSGLLIHISSLLGRMTLPFYGPYNASKWALEALAENYRFELSAFGIDSCLVEPGGYPTTFMDNLLKPSDGARDAGYGDFAKAPDALLTNFEKALADNPAQDPQNVANAVADLVDTPAGSRSFRTVVDKMGMGEHIVGYNDQLEQITSGIFNAFGMADMLKLKTDK